MEKRTIQAAVALPLALSLVFLCACAPRLVGEEAAKRAGLALLREAFDICETDAQVEYFESAGTSVVNNREVQPDGGMPVQIYLVTIPDETGEAELYYVEVDAKTGVAYYAAKSEWLLAPLTEEQQQRAIKQKTAPEGAEEDAMLQNDGTEAFIGDYVTRRFQKEVALVSPEDGCCRESVLSARIRIGYFVTFADGSLYRVGFSWPTMEAHGTEP